MAKETVFGTPVTPTSYLPDTGCTLEADPGFFSPELMMGKRDLHVFPMYGEAKYAGAVDSPLFPSNGMMMLAYAIGTDAVTGTVAPYSHTISEANALASMTIEKDIGNFQSLQFAGCRISKTSIKCAAGNQPVQITSDVEGRAVAVMDTPTAVNVTNEIPFVFAEAAVTMFSHARAEATSVQIDIDNGLKSTYTFSGQHGPNFLTPVTLHVSGQANFVWDSLDDSTYGDFVSMQNGTLGALQVVFAHPVAANGSVTVNLPQIVLSKYANDLKMTDVVMSSINFEALLSISSGYTIQAIVANSQSTAY